MRDVEAEPGDAPVEPEAHDVVDRLPDLLVPPVEVDLLGQEAVEVHLARRGVERPRGRSAERASPVVRRRPIRLRVPPDVPVPARRIVRGTRLLEPRVPIRGVVRHEVEDDADAAPVRFRHQPVEGIHPAEDWLDVGVVGDVVSPVPVGRDRNGAEPESVHPQPLHVVELLEDPAQVADAVAVRVRKGADVDLIQHRALPPRLPAGRHAQRYRVARGSRASRAAA